MSENGTRVLANPTQARDAVMESYLKARDAQHYMVAIWRLEPGKSEPVLDVHTWRWPAEELDLRAVELLKRLLAKLDTERHLAADAEKAAKKKAAEEAKKAAAAGSTAPTTPAEPPADNHEAEPPQEPQADDHEAEPPQEPQP